MVKRGLAKIQNMFVVPCVETQFVDTAVFVIGASDSENQS